MDQELNEINTTKNEVENSIARELN